jgi:HAD superfamily hydrolase (TIGR01509 family)
MNSAGEPAAGIIFDFNGTLVWDNVFHERAWLQFAEQLGVSLDIRSYYERVHGKTTRAIFQDLLGRTVSEDELRSLTDEKEQLYRDLCLESRHSYTLSPGAESLLDRLRDADVPMNIATASEIDNLNFFIKMFTLERWFDTSLIVYDDNRIPNKPAPDIYVEAARRIGLHPRETIIVEDSYSGALAASRAGCARIFIAGERQTHAQPFSQIENICGFVDDLSALKLPFFQ